MHFLQNMHGHGAACECSQARWSLLHRLQRLWQAATGTHKLRYRCCLSRLKYFLLVINLIARYGFCGDFAGIVQIFLMEHTNFSLHRYLGHTLGQICSPPEIYLQLGNTRMPFCSPTGTTQQPGNTTEPQRSPTGTR